jgi:hypothetical protein
VQLIAVHPDKNVAPIHRMFRNEGLKHMDTRRLAATDLWISGRQQGPIGNDLGRCNGHQIKQRAFEEFQARHAAAGR